MLNAYIFLCWCDNYSIRLSSQITYKLHLLWKKETKKQKKEKKKLSSKKTMGDSKIPIAGHICRYMSICTDARTPRTHATLTPLLFNSFFLILSFCFLDCDCKRDGEGVELSHHRIQDRTNAFHRQMNLAASLNKLNLTGTEAQSSLSHRLAMLHFFVHILQTFHIYIFFLSITSYYT